MMHNKTDRFGPRWRSATSSLVGPSTYTVICQTQLKNRVPFLSSAKQGSTFGGKAFCDAYYDLPDQKNKKLGCSPHYTAPRSSRFETESPGPAAHYVKLPKKCVREIPAGVRPKKLYVCPVPYTLVGTGPSVPSKLHANGYSVGPFGDVTPIPPTDYDTTLGPAFYTLSEESRYEKTYRGLDWSCGKTRRGFYDIDLNLPGPADYDVKLPACSRDKENDEFREMARLLTFVPRFLDKQEMITKNNNYPGPGDYDVGNVNLCKRCPPLEPAAFSSRSKRFTHKSNDNPSPSAYVHKPSKYYVSKLCYPFGNGSSRFARKKHAATPSPADYDIKGVITKKLEEKVKYAVFKPPFGNSAPRSTLEMNKDAICGPSPQCYTVNDLSSCKIYPTSPFKSKVVRFPGRCKTFEGAPARYNDMESFLAVNKKKSHNAGKVPFNVKSPKGGFYDKAALSNPSPADYELIPKREKKGHVVPTSPRWKEPKDNFPGPGAYLIHPKYRTGVYNAYKTHNLILKEDVLKMTLRSHPRYTWAKWAIELKKNKKLRWFIDEGKDYIHCRTDMTMYKT